jgi:excinuclease ABC subunit B
LERVQILNDLRKGVFDVLVGINLLREGLDLPEVSLVAILDADKEGFLRSETALIQTCGRAARNIHGRVIMYADKMTKSIVNALAITKERRALQQAYNEQHGITPRSVRRERIEDLAETFGEVVDKLKEEEPTHPTYLTAREVEDKIKDYEIEMRKAAKELLFEDASYFRDLMHHYEKLRILEDLP